MTSLISGGKRPVIDCSQLELTFFGLPRQEGRRFIRATAA